MMGAALIAGLASCSKDAGSAGSGEYPTGTGSLKITLDFEKAPSTYAATPSTAKPLTDWTNIESLAIFFVDEASNEIKNAQSIPLDSLKVGNRAEDRITTLRGIPTGSYSVYLVANWDKGNLDNMPWTVNTAKGRNIEDLYIWSLGNTDYDDYKHKTTEADSYGYAPAPEVFVAKHPDIPITADGTYTDQNAYELTRIVSLVRVRIDQSRDNEMNRNDLIDFTIADANNVSNNASLRIRRIKTGISLKYTDTDMAATTGRAESDAVNTVFFFKGAFGDTEPTADDGYDVTENKKVLTDNFTSWKDVILIPAGSANDSKEKLDVVVTGIVKADESGKNRVYVPAGYPKTLNGTEVTFAPVGSQIAWAGAVSRQLTANGIMELNLTLLSAGTWVDSNDPDKPLPQPEEYGNLDITVNLVDWGAIVSEDINM